MFTIKELKMLFENSSKECVVYDDTGNLWEGEISEIPEDYDYHYFELYDATYNNEIRGITFEILIY